MKNEEKKQTGLLGKVVVIGTVIVAGVTDAMAGTATLTAPTFALDDVAVVAVALLGGLAGFWAIRRGLSLAK